MKHSSSSSSSSSSSTIGQPVLDAEKRRKVLALLTLDCSRRVAAEYVGCASSTITRTAERDYEFGQQVVEAEKCLDIEGLSVIRKAGREPKYWRAYAWLLERRRPDDYAPKKIEKPNWPREYMQIITKLTDYLLEELPKEDIDRILLKLKEIIHDLRADLVPILLEYHPELKHRWFKPKPEPPPPQWVPDFCGDIPDEVLYGPPEELAAYMDAMDERLTSPAPQRHPPQLHPHLHLEMSRQRPLGLPPSASQRPPPSRQKNRLAGHQTIGPPQPVKMGNLPCNTFPPRDRRLGQTTRLP